VLNYEQARAEEFGSSFIIAIADAHTNTVENAFSLLKLVIMGTMG
jgi:hypothetical protein